MTGDSHVPVPDLGVSVANGFAVDPRYDVSTGTHTSERSDGVSQVKSPSKLGRVLASRYELRSILGVGAYGEVFSAWDIVRSRLVAIKVLKNTRANVLMQFKQEFRGIFELNHPNLVRVYKLGREGSVWFIVMEFIDGVPITNSPAIHPPRTTPRQLTRENTVPFSPNTSVQDGRSEHNTLNDENHTAPLVDPVLPLATTQDRIGQLVQGTYALHQFGILHCDLKPSNVMVSNEGGVVIIDFGASRYTMSVGAHYQHHWIRAGTRAYMAPEARSLRESTHGLDWYAIGVMLAEMLTGLHARVISSMPPPTRIERLREVGARHPEYADMCELCVKLIEPIPENRAGYREAIEACYGERAPQIYEAARRYTPEFSGRSEELTALADAYSFFRGGRPHTILVEGAFGSGKSAVCGEFLRRISLEEDPPHVLVAHCKNDELLSYRAFDGVVDGISAILRTYSEDELDSYLPLCTPTLCSLFPTLRTVHPSLDADNNPPPSPQDALFALQTLLRRIAEKHRLVIWVSNVEQADRDSLRWIARIFAPGQRPNVFLLLSRTPKNELDEASVDIDTLGYAIPTITLRPLNKHAARNAVKCWLPPKLKSNDRLIHAIRIASDGRLMTMRALSRFPDSTIDLPENISVEGLLDRRIESLPNQALHLLHALAVSFHAVSSRTLAFIANRHPINVDKLLQDLLHHAFIVQKEINGDEGYELIDTVLRRHILDRMSEQLQQYFHGRYATAGLTPTLGPMRPIDIVAHLQHAKQHDAAARYAIEVAEASDHGGAYDSAAQMYALVIELRKTQGLPTSSDLRMRAVECNLHSGRLLSAARLLVQLAQEAKNPLDAAALYQRAAETYIVSGHTEEGRACSKHARKRHTPRAQRYLPRLVYIILMLNRLKRRLQDFDIEETTLEPLKPSTLSRLRTHRMAGFDIGIVDPVSGLEFALRELELSLNTGSRIPISRTLAGLSTFVSAMGGKYRELAKEWVALAIELADAAGCRTSLEWARVGRASVEYHESNYSDAWTEIHSSYLWFRQNTSQQWMMLTYTSVHLVYLAYMTGRVDALRSLYYGELVEARARNNRMIETTITFAGFITWLIDDAPHAGRAVLERIQIPREGALYRLHDFFIVQYLAELCLYEQRIDECDTHIKSLKHYETTVISRSMELTCMAARFLRGRLILADAVHTGTLRKMDAQRLRTLAHGLRKNDDKLAQGGGFNFWLGSAL